MSVKASPISKTASVLILVIGIFVLFTGVAADVVVNVVAGAAFILLGLALYGLLHRFTRKLQEEVAGQKG